MTRTCRELGPAPKPRLPSSGGAAGSARCDGACSPCRPQGGQRGRGGLGPSTPFTSPSGSDRNWRWQKRRQPHLHLPSAHHCSWAPRPSTQLPCCAYAGFGPLEARGGPAHSDSQGPPRKPAESPVLRAQQQPREQLEHKEEMKRRRMELFGALGEQGPGVKTPPARATPLHTCHVSVSLGHKEICLCSKKDISSRGLSRYWEAPPFKPRLPGGRSLLPRPLC